MNHSVLRGFQFGTRLLSEIRVMRFAVGSQEDFLEKKVLQHVAMEFCESLI